MSQPAGTLTQQGMIVGTFQYMAPDVLQGQQADACSDIFSFGCVLYAIYLSYLRRRHTGRILTQYQRTAHVAYVNWPAASKK